MDWNSSTKMPPVNYLASEEGKPVVTSLFLVSIPSRLERVRRYLTSFIDIRRGEILLGFYLRAGAWIDGIEILTSLGRKSGVYGNAHGGSGYVSWSPPILWPRLTMRDSCRHTLIPPLGYKIAGISGSSASWVDGFSLIIMHWPLACHALMQSLLPFFSGLRSNTRRRYIRPCGVSQWAAAISAVHVLPLSGWQSLSSLKGPALSTWWSATFPHEIIMSFLQYRWHSGMIVVIERI